MVIALLVVTGVTAPSAMSGHAPAHPPLFRHGRTAWLCRSGVPRKPLRCVACPHRCPHGIPSIETTGRTSNAQQFFASVGVASNRAEALQQQMAFADRRSSTAHGASCCSCLRGAGTDPAKAAERLSRLLRRYEENKELSLRRRRRFPVALAAASSPGRRGWRTVPNADTAYRVDQDSSGSRRRPGLLHAGRLQPV